MPSIPPILPKGILPNKAKVFHCPHKYFIFKFKFLPTFECIGLGIFSRYIAGRSSLVLHKIITGHLEPRYMSILVRYVRVFCVDVT